MRNFSLVTIFLLGATPVFWAQQDKEMARFTVLVPKDGMQRQFEEGYKRHLKWHVDNGDTWNWYGWFVISGERRGFFMDTTFGHSWADFDKPVNPTSDVADLEIHVLPFARVHTQFTCASLPAQSVGASADLSAAFPRVLYFKIKPGQESTFERFLASFRKDVPKITPEQKFLWFRVEDGEQVPQYLLFLPHENYAAMQNTNGILAKVLGQNKEAQAMYQDSVAEVKAETMRYRADMTYLPK